jgi:hypothetical protein
LPIEFMNVLCATRWILRDSAHEGNNGIIWVRWKYSVYFIDGKNTKITKSHDISQPTRRTRTSQKVPNVLRLLSTVHLVGIIIWFCKTIYYATGHIAVDAPSQRPISLYSFNDSTLWCCIKITLGSIKYALKGISVEK